MLSSSLRQTGSKLLRAGCQSSTSALRSSRCSSLASARRPLALSSAQRRYASASASSSPDPNYNFLSGSTANYIDEMYMQWKHDPKSVHVSWQVYFRNMESGDMPISQAFQPPPNLVPNMTGGVRG